MAASWKTPRGYIRYVTIHELPSTREVARVEMPLYEKGDDPVCHMIRHWDGTTLAIHGHVGTKTQVWFLNPYEQHHLKDAQLDKMLSDLEEERDRYVDEANCALWWDLRSAVIYRQDKTDPKTKTWIDLARDWVNVHVLGANPDDAPWIVRRYDRTTGQQVFQLRNLRGWPYNLVQQGKTLIVAAGGTSGPLGSGARLEAWNLEPGPRWPWAVVAGVGVAGGVGVVGRWRRKRVGGVAGSSKVI